MKTIIFDKNDYNSYENFYKDIFVKLDGIHTLDFEDYPDLNCSADMLFEFLYYKEDENIKYILINFDLDEIKKQKTFENYKLNLIIETFKDFVEKYPNNKFEFENKIKN